MKKDYSEDYRIPVLKIQDKLLSLETNPDYIKLRTFCFRHINTGCRFRIKCYLEMQWFPVICTNDRYLANLLMKKYAK
jgi:hypothetical protein